MLKNIYLLIKLSLILLSLISKQILSSADINLLDFSGYNQLHKAIIKSDPIKVQELILLQADPNIKSSSGFSALHYAAINKHENNKLIINLLAEASGANIDIANNLGETPLMLASAYNNLDALNALLALRNININAQDSSGFTALHKAAFSNYLRIIMALITNPKIKINIEDFCNHTALDFTYSHEAKLLLTSAGATGSLSEYYQFL